MEGTITTFAARRPVTTYLLLMYPPAWGLIAIAFVLRLPGQVAIAVGNFIDVLGPPFS